MSSFPEAPFTGTLFAVEATHPRLPPDIAARRAAIDATRSVLVEAPAGAGKTNLLTQRFLALLATVESPEQVLAITFTRAAAAEMRSRILSALEAAKKQPAAQENEGDELPLARRALQHAEVSGWQLLQQPHRLSVETIDSLCLRLAHAQPILARLGGKLTPADDSDAMYIAAARRTVAQLGDPENNDLHRALTTLLLRRDNNLQDLERLLAAMLRDRSQWLTELPLGNYPDEDWEAIRAQLEEPFTREHERVLAQLAEALDEMPELVEEWFVLASGAAANLEQDPEDYAIRALRLLTETPGVMLHEREHWHALSFFVLTKSKTWRKVWTKKEGFLSKSDKGAASEKELRDQLKKRMQECCRELEAHPFGPHLQQALCQLRSLPPLHYSPEQWNVLRAIFSILRRAYGELLLVFAEQNAVDFTQIAQAADEVLSNESDARGLLQSESMQHLLIDEFQDTSRTQFRLVANLLKEWVAGDGRTAFVVGDPLQSIYGFRQAEVALFHQTKEHGLPCGDGRHLCDPLHLTHNFRSHRALVDTLNTRFEAMFRGSTTDTFIPSTAWPTLQSQPSYVLHTHFFNKEGGETAGDAQAMQAGRIASILREEQPHIEAAKAVGEGEYRVAVLVRTRTDLTSILPALREARIPFRAVELEPLANQPEVFDMLMLLRAMLHSSERVAWLSVLRAPWCGLSLADLHTLVGSDDRDLLRRPVIESIETRAALLSPEGQIRLARTWSVLREALATRYNESNGLSLSLWVERTWMALGGPACISGTARENVETFLLLLDQLAPSGEEVLQGDFSNRLARLCAQPDTSVDERFGVQVMTMHKAKGLGFEVVLLPSLERKQKADTAGLLSMLQRARADDPLQPELLLAPITDRDGDTQDALQSWVMGERKARETEERKRLFYVACTRARKRLHLFATLSVKAGEIAKPASGSLLDAAWPALEQEVTAQWNARQGNERQAAEPADALAFAASASAPLAMPGPATHSLDRLPQDYAMPPWADDIPVPATTGASTLFQRKAKASPAARVRGTALHALMERLAEDRSTPLPLLVHAANRALREGGYSQAEAASAAEKLAAIADAVRHDAAGAWLLADHASAQSESSWQVVDATGNIQTLRVDRTFLAGDTPSSAGATHRWIVDYKSGSPSEGVSLEAWLLEEQELWRGQLEAYGSALAAATREPLRYGLYFPEVLRLVFWSA